jgi:lipoprotein-anchoring transpeptidase ErfK/SrfK
MSRLGALGAVAAGALLVAAPLASATSSRPSKAPVEIARLVISTPVRARPTTGSRLVTRLSAVRPITLQQTALPVLRRAAGPGGVEWLLVRLPSRPVGRVGWIQSSNANVVSSPWRVVVDRSARRALVYRSGRLSLKLPVVVGKSSTPTPRGGFFVVEHVRQAEGSVLGPWALATSAYSHVLQEFDGGPGQIALHGRDGDLLRDPLGTAASHGCIRLDNAAIRTLSKLLPNGTPIEIF